ncbi:hypothetical protein [Pseudoalteromonas sp. H71]|uniref:hypothetical protein n=1 Tax=Pseudoalteromonas sp. H71 TaxID=1348395 RepID=UPI000730E3AB|nr:hypothetical protein [Pseudoalteromonas sp. H71]KTD96342.1 hypothetical protein ATS71_16595 [Pseudoalteromonas sp. H71]
MKYLLSFLILVSFFSFANEKENANARSYLTSILSTKLGSYPENIKFEYSYISEFETSLNIDKAKFNDFIKTNITKFDELRVSLSDVDLKQIKVKTSESFQGEFILVQVKVYPPNLSDNSYFSFNYMYIKQHGSRSLPIFGNTTE